MNLLQLLSRETRLAASILVLAMARVAVWAGPPPTPEPPPPAPEVIIDPNDPEQVATPAVARPATPVDAKKVEKGRRMYEDYCQKCHGVNMVSPGGGFFDLRTFPHNDRPRFVQSVTLGKRAMPAWGSVLKSDDLEVLWAYVSSGGAER